jgi:hypothetical protein
MVHQTQAAMTPVTFWHGTFVLDTADKSIYLVTNRSQFIKRADPASRFEVRLRHALALSVLGHPV